MNGRRVDRSEGATRSEEETGRNLLSVPNYVLWPEKYAPFFQRIQMGVSR